MHLSFSYVSLRPYRKCACASVAERLEIIAALWDSIDAAHTPLTPAQAAEIDRRLASFEADKANVMTWEEFKADLEERAR